MGRSNTLKEKSPTHEEINIIQVAPQEKLMENKLARETYDDTE